jgi:DNA-binding LytR/AlgR family response regulator
MIRAVIVEDEPLAAHYLRTLLLETGKVDVTGMAREGTTGLLVCSEQSPDVAFLDVRMPGPDGLALASHLRQLPRPPLIVFTTGHANRAADAFRLDAVDYLLKPLDPAEVSEAVNRLQSRLAGSEPPAAAPDTAASAPSRDADRLPIKNSRDDVVRLIPRWEIVAAIRRDRRTWIHTATDEHPTYYPIGDLLAWLGDPPFLRVARDAVVNLQSVGEVIHYGDRLYRLRLRDRNNTSVEASRSGAVRLSTLLKPSL